MPIVYVHGVTVRDGEAGGELIERASNSVPWARVAGLLREHVAPALSSDPAGVPILRAYWGDLGGRLAWGGISRVSAPAGPVLPPQRLAELDAESLGRILEHAALQEVTDVGAWPRVIAAAWAVARDEEVRERLSACASGEEEQELLRREVEAAYRRQPGSEGESAERGRRRMESFARQLRGWRQTQAARTFTLLRRPVDDALSLFLGDIATYLLRRGNASAPGPIPLRVLRALALARLQQLERGGEPLVVLSHSMGGQIVYDVVTHFLPKSPQYAGIRIDFWAAVASQVGLFEELKLFLESSPEHGAARGRLVPHPDRRNLGHWWNVWDHADFLSYRAEGIFEGVDDSAFFVGAAPQSDHQGYLDHPGFYRTLAAKLRATLPQSCVQPVALAAR